MKGPSAQPDLVRKRSRKVNLVIKEVPHKKQRYETVGDWIPGRPDEIRVSSMRDERYTFLVALHELVEYELCRMKGISDKKVVAFDKMFEAERGRGLHDRWAEPGDDPKAPYREEHAFANVIERLVAQKLGVKWSHYEKTVVALYRNSQIAMKQVVRQRG